MYTSFGKSKSPLKKDWHKPIFHSLNIHKDTFAGTPKLSEQNPGQGPQNKKP